MYFLEQALIGAYTHKKLGKGERHNHACDLGPELLCRAWNTTALLRRLVNEHFHVVKHEGPKHVLLAQLISLTVAKTCDQRLQTKSISLAHDVLAY